MKKTLIIMAALCMTGFSLRAQVSEEDYKALKAVYDKLGGKNWTNNSGWDFSGSAADVKPWKKDTGTGWYGVTEIKKGRVTKLELSDNNLKGKLPEEVFNLTSLRSLNLSKNNISGKLPEKISGMTLLSVLDLNNNQLSGELPKGFTKLGAEAWSRAQSEGKSGTDIKIHLYRNNFSGPLPAEFGEMALLHKPARTISIDISNNNFSGELPASITKLKEMTTFRASSNEFSGNVPEGLAELPRLKTLKLDKNNFSGKVPKNK